MFENSVLTWENVIHPDDYSRVMQHFELYLAGKIDQYEIEYRCKKADGSYLWILDRAKIIAYNEDGTVARMVGVHQNIHLRKSIQSEMLTQNQLLEEGNISLEKMLQKANRKLEKKNRELRKKIEEVEYLSVTDTLTQLPNRRKFETEIEKEVARANRYHQELSFILFDIDFFKHVNDKYGHKSGDLVLKKLAFWLRQELRTHDMLARWGGEEFALLLPNTKLDDAIDIAQRLRGFINQIDFDRDLYITCSFGVTQYIKGESVDDLFMRVDDASIEPRTWGEIVWSIYSQSKFLTSLA